MTDMKRILDSKGYTFYFVPPEATIRDAIRLMVTKTVGFLLVMDGESLEGVFSERDAIRHLALDGPQALEARMQDVMTTQVYQVNLHTSVDACMGLMTGSGIRHVPVMDGRTVMGVVSIRDVVREVVADREIIIKGLENYIVGGDFAT